MTPAARLSHPRVSKQPTVEDLQGRLLQAIDDLRAGRIDASESNRISAEAQAELRIVEAAMRTARLATRIGTA
jgi:hypothetical protein